MAHAVAQRSASPLRWLTRISRFLPSRERLARSEAIWLGLVAYLVLAKALSETIVPIGFRGTDQQAPLALRWGEYLIWHILYGNLIYGAVFPS